jgi:small subunit ribosomal protein S20
MPISPSAKKSLRKSIKNRKANLSFKNKMKLVVKAFLEKPSEKGLAEAFRALDKAKKKGLVHKNKVSRVKSQLSKKIGTEGVAKKSVKKSVKRTAKEKMSK